MRIGLSQYQRQQLRLTQEMRLSMEILQMNVMELREFVREKLNDNPLLEWSFRETCTSGHAGRASAADDEGDLWLKVAADSRPSLEEALTEQLNELDLDRTTRRHCLLIIRNLDENGYLDCPLESLARQTGVDKEELERTLAIVQGLEPKGVGAANLRECLLLQLDRDDPADDLPRLLIAEAFDDLLGKRYGRLARRFGVTVENIQAAVDRIGQLNPKPGSIYGKEKTEYVVPDIIVRLSDEGKPMVALRKDTIPSFSWNHEYLNMLKQTDNPQIRSFLRKRYAEAERILRCIEQRNTTLLNVASAIFERQADFCRIGMAGLKPVTQSEIARTLGVHESTVSRAIRGKYADTPQGTFELKRFFTTAIRKREGDPVSAVHVKELIRKIIAAEDKAHPLSDQEIARILQEKGIAVARRTVTKYRESMHIGTTLMRKRWLG